MLMQILKIAVVLLVAGSGDARPQASGVQDSATQVEASDAGWRGVHVLNKSHDVVRDDSSGQPNDTHRDLKDLQYMDQSLRTVATQLLNVTGPQDMVKVATTKQQAKLEQNPASMSKLPEKPGDHGALIREVNSEISNLESVGVSFGRPMNSKFGYFETSHPGHAMAITEEELEREMSTTRLMTAYKNHPTTTGGISTWILLNPPSTTAKSADADRTKLKQPFQTEVKLTVRPSSSGSVDRVETITHSDNTIAEKITAPSPMTPTTVATTEKVNMITKKPTATTLKKIVTTVRPETTLEARITTRDQEKTESTSSATTLKIVRVTTVSTSPSDIAATSSPTAVTTTTTTTTTTKKNQGTRVTSKPKITTPRTTKPGATKPTRPGQQGRPKPTATRRTTVKLETIKNETASTGKIEKVTFKPVQIITTTQKKPDTTEKPMFVTKIKASVLMDTQRVTTGSLAATATTTTSPITTLNSNLSGADLVEVPIKSKPIGTKVNNVLKVQLKKPAEDSTQIEVEPIKVNAPVLKIQKVDRDKMDEIVKKDTEELNNSRIDLKFDFNPELTKINVETQTGTTTTTTAASSTTKRPRHNSKRKKNKGRRRKPSTTTATMPTSTIVTASPMFTSDDNLIDIAAADNAIQESKIAPETKVAPNTTKIKKKQPPKAITTQIYNFLSREVMPSFGVMSLVGLGLGLASYFLYPFGGTIARRNYETEPNYKYNLEEYGGNYGQSEEEVLSKVLQGMTSHGDKYQPAKDHGDYYPNSYQHYDGAYDAHTTKRIDSRYPSTSPIYRPTENTQPAVKYRNTEFRYPEVHTTPVYYDRKHLGDHGSEPAGSANRQFVVGNVPKEYPYEVKVAGVENGKKGVASYAPTEVIGQTQFERDIAQGFNFPPGSANVHNAYGHPEVSTASRPDDGYEEIEITPTAVAVEHGPRSLKVRRAAMVGKSNRSRFKRESVIQVIPSKRELDEEREEMEKEEDLSNEILDIIDAALPGGQPHKKAASDNNEVEDLDHLKKRQHEETNTRNKESTVTTVKSDAEVSTSVPENADSSSKMSEKGDDGVTTASSPSPDTETHSTSSPKEPEATTVEWFENSTATKPAESFSLFSFVKKVAEIKFRLGLTILKHASEGFARYLGHVQKRINGEE